MNENLVCSPYGTRMVVKTLAQRVGVKEKQLNITLDRTGSSKSYDKEQLLNLKH